MLRPLPSEEYVEQAHLFESLAKQVLLELELQQPLQALLQWLKQEVLATTKLPLAIDYMIAELKHVGTIGTAFTKLPHYFSTFQSYLINEAESERGRFDIWQAFRILHQDAKLRAAGTSPNAMFFFQFETLCRNRLSYDHGIEAMSRDFFYDPTWSAWILTVRHKIGLVDLTDLVYVHSQNYVDNESRRLDAEIETPTPLLFSDKEGRIALANRHKEPLFFFSSLQRHLGIPASPQAPKPSESARVLPKVVRDLERLEVRIRLLEEEQKQKGIDLSQFYEKYSKPPRHLDE
ncbi:MAG: hypothetical protein JNL67_02710 [Planctomycetaceae bacterium]|nr:hypothetical protein [Planctomycetaceae bacterium]